MCVCMCVYLFVCMYVAVSGDGKALLWDCGSAQCLSAVASVPCKINACVLASDSSLLETHSISSPGE